MGIVQAGHFRIAQDVGCPAMGVSQLSNVGIRRKVANRFGYVRTAGSTHREAMAAAVLRQLRRTARAPSDSPRRAGSPRARVREIWPPAAPAVPTGRCKGVAPDGASMGEPVPRACWWAGCKGGRDIPRPIFQGESELCTGADWFPAPASPQPPTCILPACKVGGQGACTCMYQGGWNGGGRLPHSWHGATRPWGPPKLHLQAPGHAGPPPSTDFSTDSETAKAPPCSKHPTRVQAQTRHQQAPNDALGPPKQWGRHPLGLGAPGRGCPNHTLFS